MRPHRRRCLTVKKKAIRLANIGYKDTKLYDGKMKLASHGVKTVKLIGVKGGGKRKRLVAGLAVVAGAIALYAAMIPPDWIGALQPC